jgi:hypothetical protein
MVFSIYLFSLFNRNPTFSVFSQVVNRNNYGNDHCAKEFGIKVTNELALVDARVLPAPTVSLFFSWMIFYTLMFQLSILMIIYIHFSLSTMTLGEKSCVVLPLVSGT